jgi:predicted RecA/RadA family phage recombinase
MKGFICSDDEFVAPAPYAVSSGGGALVGVTFGVAKADYGLGARGVFRRTGYIDLAKAAGEAWVAFTTKLYWDNTNKRLTSTASGNTFVGVAAQTQASADTVGRALLTGQLS